MKAPETGGRDPHDSLTIDIEEVTGKPARGPGRKHKPARKPNGQHAWSDRLMVGREGPRDCVAKSRWS